MLQHDVTGAQLDILISTHELIFVDFWATWCAPCVGFSKIFESIALENESIVFAKVNVEKEKELTSTLQVFSIPHLIVFKKGIIIYSDSGNLPKNLLNELVQQAIAVDVNSRVPPTKF